MTLDFVDLLIMSEKYISELHAQNNSWISQLDLASDEIKSFQERLGEVNAANTGMDVRAQVEHFQNQFIRQNEVIDILKHDIHAYEKSLMENVSSNETASDHRKAEEAPELGDRMQTFGQIFAELKSTFVEFVGSKL